MTLLFQFNSGLVAHSFYLLIARLYVTCRSNRENRYKYNFTPHSTRLELSGKSPSPARLQERTMLAI